MYRFGGVFWVRLPPESGAEDALPDGWFLGRGGYSGFGWLFGGVLALSIMVLHTRLTVWIIMFR